MLDPNLTNYITTVAAELTVGVLGALGKRLRDSIEGTPREQALRRCYQAATAALLPPEEAPSEVYRPLLQEFLAEPSVRVELAQLVRGNSPDQTRLVEAFADTVFGLDLPPFDFPARLAAAVEAFLQVAEQEPELAELIQTAQLRDATATLRQMATDLQAIRQAVEQARPAGHGNIKANDITTYGDIVTGIQHIVNVYHAGAGQWQPADYQAALERYLDWLRASTGRVVLRGIKRGGQQAVDLALADVYVPLAAEALPDAREQLKRSLKANSAPASEPAEMMSGAAPAEKIKMENLLGQGSKLAVVGAPGCGKTTVLQHIAWTLAEALRTHRPDLAAERLGLSGELPLPIYVPLNLFADHRRRYAADPDPHRRQLSTFISHYLIERQAGLNLPEDFFATLLNEGRHIILLLDGLDEVPNEAERVLVSQAVNDLTCARRQTRVVVTSRTRAYQGRAVLGQEFRVIRVLALDMEQVGVLIKHAYQAIYPEAAEQYDREQQANDLIDCVVRLEADRAARLGDAEETRLITTPLLVRMLLIVHFNLRRLPDQRAELYMEVVDTLLTSAHNPDQAVAQKLELLGGDWRQRRDMLQHLAFQMHSRGPEAGREIGERELVDLLQNYLINQRRKPADVAETMVDSFVSVSRQRGGLLEERAGRHRFSHLSFQEFLTARYLAEVTRDVSRIVEFIEAQDRVSTSWWREPILLTAGYLNVTAPDTAASLIHKMGQLDAPDAPRTAPALAAAELAGAAFLEWSGAETTQELLARRLVDLLTDTTLVEPSPALRAAAGQVLARLDDPRPGIGLIKVPHRSPLPDIAWCKVPDGRFLLGANQAEEAWKDEHPQHELHLPDFYIARYPVTNAHYAPFIEAGGYNEPRWWTEAGWAWRKGQEPEPDLSYIQNEETRKNVARWLAQRTVEHRDRPWFWDDDQWNLPNQPVVGVTWYEAMAYCVWLNEKITRSQAAADLPESWAQLRSKINKYKSKMEIRLPTEAEWEKAAGWDSKQQHKRVYAWGDDWDPSRANVDKGVGRTSAVGVFPQGIAACGALDMTGNVWEWTTGKFVDYPYRNDDRNNSGGDDWRVLRGGSWYFNQRVARVSSRNNLRPDLFYGIIGFRLVVAPVL